MTSPHPLPDGFELLRSGGCVAAVRSSCKDQLLALGLLDRPAFEDWRDTGRPIGAGRGGAVSVSLGPEDDDRAVIRHCRRGSILGVLLGDVYFTGARPLEELAVSEAARTAGVPTPECLAAVVWQTGPFYSGDLIVRAVPGAVSLEDWLRGRPGPGSIRALTGALADTFSRLVSTNIYHPDLHAGNVLVREENGLFHIEIIDFDKANVLDPLPPRLRDRMLFRFNRALVKRSLAPTPVTLSARIRFCKELGIAKDRKDMRRIVSRCAAHLRRHSWHY